MLSLVNPMFKIYPPCHQVNRNGVITRLIPSLDGGLYQFDGESVQPVPFNADTLLSSSFRFNDDSTIVGGKHAHSYGIDAQTGQVSDNESE
jgi:translation initiation factor 2-alpha kinase 3